MNERQSESPLPYLSNPARRAWAVGPLATALLWVTLGGLAAQQKSESTKASNKPSAEVRAAIAGAKAALAKAKGTKGAERQSILRAAAEAYAKVAQDFAHESVGSAPACFTAAETFRKIGEVDRAVGLYQQAVERDAGRFAERGTLELAHLMRRKKDRPRAIEFYTKVTTLKPTSVRAHQARLWIARLHLDSGQRDQALAAYRVAVDKAPSPRRQIDACDDLAGLLVKMGRLDEAERAIARAESATRSAGSEGKPDARQAESLARAYAKMSSRRALQRARDKASKAHDSAEDIERSRKAPPSRGGDTAATDAPTKRSKKSKKSRRGGAARRSKAATQPAPKIQKADPRTLHVARPKGRKKARKTSKPTERTGGE